MCAAFYFILTLLLVLAASPLSFHSLVVVFFRVVRKDTGVLRKVEVESYQLQTTSPSLRAKNVISVYGDFLVLCLSEHRLWLRKHMCQLFQINFYVVGRIDDLTPLLPGTCCKISGRMPPCVLAVK